MTETQTTIQPVRRAVTVERPLEDAFRVFTEGLGTWWPVATHSIADAVETVVMEGRAGGRLYERTTVGAENDWGRMLVWEPPRRVAFEWHITGTPTEVEVRFTPEGDREVEYLWILARKPTTTPKNPSNPRGTPLVSPTR